MLAQLRSHNIQIAAGNIGAPPFGDQPAAYQLGVEAQGRLITPAEFADIVLKRDPDGRITHVGDVARVSLGAEVYTTNAYLGLQDKNGKPDVNPAAAIGVLQQPGTNALQAADSVISQMKTLSKAFPPGLGYKIIYNPTEYIKDSISEVQRTLFEALLLVVVVVIVFLQSWRAAIIPILAIPVSPDRHLCGDAGLPLHAEQPLLFGLVLAIGIVVDDAIVVVENVERHLEDGMMPAEAAHATMDEVGGALVAIALVLSAVFIPAAFISGISGQFYRQFALTIATATIFSLIVSLTLSPALAALLLKPKHQHTSRRGPAWMRPFSLFAQKFNKGFDRLSHGYSNLTRRLLRMAVLMLVIYAGLIALTVWRIGATPVGFIPSQDQGNVIMSAVMPPGTSLARTDADDPQDHPAGPWGQGHDRRLDLCRGRRLHPDHRRRLRPGLSDRGQLREPQEGARHPEATMIASAQKAISTIPGAQIRILPPPPVRGIGTQGGVKMIIEDRTGKADYRKLLEQVTQSVVAEVNKDPAVTGAYTTFNTRTPRINAQHRPGEGGVPRRERQRGVRHAADLSWAPATSTISTT